MSAIPFTEDGLIEATSTKRVSAPLEQAWRQEINHLPGLTDDDRATALTSPFFERAPGKYKTGFHLTERRRVIAIQGGWWYRGVTCAEVEGNGTRITFTMVNVAPGFGKWIAHFFQARQARRQMKI